MNETPLPTTPKRVLCIEDEHFINELYTRALHKAGYEVKVVIDGRQGFDEAKTNTYDIILLDIMLPNMKGTEVLQRLRREMPSLRAKVIITTNLELGEPDRAAIENQADGYVVKAELTPRQLADFLRQLKA